MTLATMAFRTCDQGVVAGWAAFAEAAGLYEARVVEVLAQAGTGGFEAGFASCAGVRGRFLGLATPMGTAGAVLPPGWRREFGLGVPDGGTAAGGWVLAALAAAGHPGDPLLVLAGLPPRLSRSPSFRAWDDGDGAVRVSWFSPHPDADLVQVDGAVWARVSALAAEAAAGGLAVAAPGQGEVR